MRLNLIGFAISIVAAAGCTTPQMLVPADVLTMQSEYIVATERKNASGALVNESFKLGTYAITDVDREWDSTKSMSIWTFSKEKKTSGYSYVFKTPAGEAAGGCQIEGNSKSVSSFGGTTMSSSVSKIGCACRAGEVAAQAVLDSQNDAKYEGTVTLRDGEYKIAAIYETQGASLGTGNPTGYRVDGDTVMAAVDVLHPGRVWLSKNLSETQRDDLACIFTGLMLYQGKKASDEF